MIMKLITVIFLSLGLVGCTPYYNPEYPNHIYAHKVRNDFIRYATQDKNLEIFVTGGGMFETINTMNVGFFYHKFISLEEARVLFVRLNEDFIYRVNTQLKDKLKTYPANIRDFFVNLIVVDRNYNYPSLGNISSVFTKDGKVVYCSPKPEKTERGYIRILEEPYEEALRIVREQHPEVLPPDDFYSP